jgi:hypothetical protein
VRKFGIPTLAEWRRRYLQLKSHERQTAAAPESPTEPTHSTPADPSANQSTPFAVILPDTPNVLICQHCRRGLVQVPLEASQLNGLWTFLAKQSR